jgi:hypothetical protein
MSDFPERRRRGLGKPNPPPQLPPVDRAAPPLGGILGEQLEDLLDHAQDVLADCFDSAEVHPDHGKAPILRQKVRRTQQAIALLIRRLQGELAHIH